MTNPFDEIAALDAAGALTAEERRAFEESLATSPAEMHVEVAAWRETAVLFPSSVLAARRMFSTALVRGHATQVGVDVFILLNADTVTNYNDRFEPGRLARPPLVQRM